ncbi:hypothetical protein quinque_009833 [Culex quinquefasciatus]
MISSWKPSRLCFAIKVDEGLDGETFFLYVFLAAVVVQLLVLGQRFLEPGTGGAGKPEKKKNGDAQGGSAIKKPRKEVLPAPTFLQIVSRVKLGIIPAGYPDIELTVEQQEAVKEELLKKVLSQRHEKFKPKFVYCKAKAGHVMLSCQDKNTASWVKTTVPAIVPWENAQLSALEEAEIPRKDVLLAFFYRSKDDENDTILGYLESQNDDLDTSAWRIIHRTVKNDHVGWVFSVDSASMRLLEKWQFVVNYKFGQTLFRKRRPNNGVHPADEDSDGEMEVDPFYEELPSDAKPGEGEMAHSEPGKEAADDLMMKTHFPGSTEEHLYELEGEHGIGGLPKYVIYFKRPNDWRVICVPLETASFVCHKWRGKRDNKLEEVSGTEGANFCHQTGFNGGNRTREGCAADCRGQSGGVRDIEKQRQAQAIADGAQETGTTNPKDVDFVVDSRGDAQQNPKLL